MNPAWAEANSPTLREELLESTRPLHFSTLLPRHLGGHRRPWTTLETRQARDHCQALLCHAENRSFQQLDREDRKPISKGLAHLLRHRSSIGHRANCLRHL